MQLSRLTISRGLLPLLLLLGLVPMSAGASALQVEGELQPDWLQSGLDDYWESNFEDADIEYDAPDVVIYGRDQETDCGEADRRSSGAGTPPIYCPADATIYVADNSYDYLTEEYNETYWVLSLARLWGVHALWLVEYDDLDDEDAWYSIDDDASPLAYCLAGAFGGWAVDEDELTARNAGRYIDGFDDDLFDALTAGYEDGLDGCDLDLADLGGGGGDEEGVYESPNYGYTLTYDPAEWEYYIEDETPDNEYDFACFRNGLSVVCLSGNPDYEDDELTDCVEDHGASLETVDGVSDVEPRGGRGSEGDDDDRAWGTYTYTYEFEDGDEIDYIRYFECRWYGNVTVVILHDVEEDFYDDEIEAREDFVAGLAAGGRSDDDDDDQSA